MRLKVWWRMEDLDEAIRFASGRQRRALVRQKERAALRYNLEGLQTARERARQETRWGREDERYEEERAHWGTLEEIDRARWGKAGELWEKSYPAIDAVNGMFETARKLDAGMVRGLTAVFEAMGKLKPGVVEAVGRMLEEVG